MQNQTDLDQKLYKIYVWGGLPLVVIYIVIAVLVFDTPGVPGSIGFLVTVGPMLIWFAGILLYWWWVFLFKGNKELEKLALAKDEGIPSIGSLKSWNSLHQAMAISGGDKAELIKKAKEANKPIIIWFGAVNLLPLWIFGPIILGSLGLLPGFSLGVWLAGAFFWVVFMLVLTYFLLGWGSKSAEKAHLAPLGLAITQAPGLKPDVISIIGGGQMFIPDGPAIVEGERYGRLVHIETIDKYCLTVIQAILPEFKVISKEGKLTPDENAPKEIVKAIKGLRKAKRWQGIEIFAGPDGIAVQRESRGTNMWLYDLWLAEYLLDKISHGQG